MTTRCDQCHRVVPIAPGRCHITVPHVDDLESSPCAGNTARFNHVKLVRGPALAHAIAQQHHIMQREDAWEI